MGTETTQKSTTQPRASRVCEMTKKDRPAVAPFTIQEAESLISRLHADWREAIGNYDELIPLLHGTATVIEDCPARNGLQRPESRALGHQGTRPAARQRPYQDAGTAT